MEQVNVEYITHELEKNQHIFSTLLQKLQLAEQTWRPQANKWCLLEIVCHLYDEEREDFRARIKHVFNNPKLPLQPIDPVGWVTQRKYMQKNYTDILNEFLLERERSVQWLKNLDNPKWDSFYLHSKFGKMTGSMFLSNWLAHDYLHIRQILQLKFKYLQSLSGEELSYAGEW